MTPPDDNDLLTRVGPGTPMGEMMRQYWIPALKSSEVERDGPPVRLVLLGEKLIAFRDSAGRVGVMDHRCPHRCASLFYGRNEEGGIRCIYHGWKFDADGACLDQPNLPAHQVFKHKVRAKSYRVTERSGVVWVYMGARENAPPLPMMEATLLPESETRVTFTQRECNWLQAIEGDIDTSHFAFLHYGAVGADDIGEDQIERYQYVVRAPEYRIADTDWGMMYGAYRAGAPGTHYWRVAHFLFPFWTMAPGGSIEHLVWARGWIPMDDGHTMFVQLQWTGSPRTVREFKDGTPIPGIRTDIDYLPNTTDWFGRWRAAANPSNDHRIDRAAQRTRSFSGIDGIALQDQAITESMGPVVDRSFENLAPSDLMVVRTRRRLLAAAQALQKDGTVPPAVDDPEIFLSVRAGDYLAPANADWMESYRDQIRRANNPTGRLAAAE